MAEEVFKQKDGQWVGQHSARRYEDYSVDKTGPESSRTGIATGSGEQGGEPFEAEDDSPMPYKKG